MKKKHLLHIILLVLSFSLFSTNIEAKGRFRSPERTILSRLTFENTALPLLGTAWVAMLGLGLYMDYWLPHLLPGALRDVQHFDVCYVRSVRQEADACAWYAILNAYAIQELCYGGKRITSWSVSRQMRGKLIPRIKKNKEFILQSLGVSSLWGGLQSGHKDELITFLGLYDVYNIRVSPPGELATTYCSDEKDAVIAGAFKRRGLSRWENSFLYVITCMPIVLDEFLRKEGDSKHIILSMPSGTKSSDYHAVLLSIIKRSGRKPLLIYMDSNNVSFNGCSIKYIAPYYVVDFIQKLDQAMEAIVSETE
ncbi:hypothetical protein E3J61_03550 [Candidatus Dependentiae bacterium]|nr:MAG: hypothetical protein E3J61_03550 [Candidatus Dependentiae bacterium]